MITNLVGMRIRAVRAQRKMTQQYLADLAGIPRATLATVERDESNPSLCIVYKIAFALGMKVDDLIESSRNKVHLVPAARMRQLSTPDQCYHATTVSPNDVHHFTQQIFTLCVDGVYNGRPHPPGSDEYLHILDGEVILEVVDEVYHLHQGDTARFPGNVVHVYRNPLPDQEARGLITILEGILPEEDHHGSTHEAAAVDEAPH
jgi:DNA-binding XRE family transcriptional regulator